MRLLAAALLLTSCATTTATKMAPWRSEPLTSVPTVYAAEWQKAENKSTCRLIAFKDVGEEGKSATPRAANFSGGWGIAYDLPDLRSAFGIAGAGVSASDPAYDKWPYVQSWDDGSRVEYGPEGGTGPNQLAYVKIQGQDCLYNVWSRLGRSHLEHLLRELRFVTPNE